MVTIKILTSQLYSDLKEELTELYLHSFTTGELAQHITRGEAEKKLDELQQRGCGMLAIYQEKLAGMVLGTPLTFDIDFPFQQHPEISPDKTIYIAELMVHADVRGQGVASALIRKLLENEKEKGNTDAVIRVWDQNIPALTLYRKFGFNEIDGIVQEKIQPDGVTRFQMNKVYLHKRLIT